MKLFVSNELHLTPWLARACLYNIKTSIGGHLHATDTLLADMNAAVDNVAVSMS